MPKKVLKNKPLVEAIFELRWQLQTPQQGMKLDPHYRILIGRIYEKLKDEYPFHEELPTAYIPDELAGHVVQHRFRSGQARWPLVQIGPGIITVNDTEEYVWDSFKERILGAIDALLACYPGGDTNLKIFGLLLRYIDAIDFNFETDDILTFLKNQMKTGVELYPRLFDRTGVGKLPLGFELMFSFPSLNPKGVAHLRFYRGKKKESDALIWETRVQSSLDGFPPIPDGIKEWLERAHDLTDDWFSKLIEGELEKRFE